MSEKKNPAPAATVAETDLLKGLDRLEQLAKAQITGKQPGNNEPKGTWANGQEPTEPSDADSDVSGDGGDEERDGKKSDTDYKPKAAPVRKGMDGGGKRDDDKDDGEDDKDDEVFGGGDKDDDGDNDGDGDADDADKKRGDDKEIDKSFADRARASKTIRSGVEVSPFLRDLVNSVNKSLVSMERRLRRDLGRHIDKSATRQRSFNKGLADALSGLGAVALEQSDLMKALSAQPARPPKSQMSAVRPVQKSFDGGDADAQLTLPDGSTVPQLDRGVVMQRLLAGVSKGLISAGEVVKFESTGIVHPALYKSLVSDERFAK